MSSQRPRGSKALRLVLSHTVRSNIYKSVLLQCEVFLFFSQHKTYFTQVLLQIAGRGEVDTGYHGYASPIQLATGFRELRHFRAKQCVWKDAHCCYSLKIMLSDITHIEYVVYSMDFRTQPFVSSCYAVTFLHTHIIHHQLPAEQLWSEGRSQQLDQRRVQHWIPCPDPCPRCSTVNNLWCQTRTCYYILKSVIMVVFGEPGISDVVLVVIKFEKLSYRSQRVM